MNAMSPIVPHGFVWRATVDGPVSVDYMTDGTVMTGWAPWRRGPAMFLQTGRLWVLSNASYRYVGCYRSPGADCACHACQRRLRIRELRRSAL